MDPTTLRAMTVTTKVAQLCTTPCLTITEKRLDRNPTKLSAHVWLVSVLILRPRLQVCPRFLVVSAFMIESSVSDRDLILEGIVTPQLDRLGMSHAESPDSSALHV